MGAGSAVKTGIFGIFGGAYRYAPISNLYVYGRAQDIALQKVRSNIHYRNHLRLWLAPVTVKGMPVLIGQITLQSNGATIGQAGHDLWCLAWNLQLPVSIVMRRHGKMKTGPQSWTQFQNQL